MIQKLKVAVIGAGKMGEFHLQKYLGMPHVEVLGFFEPNEKRAAQVQQQYTVRSFSSVAELVFEADAVSVTSPTGTHFSNCKQALEAGTHVLVEKPMCDDIVQASELLRIATEKKLTLQVGYLERFRLSRLTRLVPQSGLRFIEARWGATQLSRDTSLDVVGDLVVHPLDMVLSLCHEEPIEVQVSGFPFVTHLLDVFEARLLFPSGLVAHLFVNRVAQHRERRITLFGQGTSATLNFLTNHIEIVRSNKGETERVSMESQGSDPDVLTLQLEAYLRAIQTGTAPLVTAQDGLRVLRTITRLRHALDLQDSPVPAPIMRGEAYVT